MPRTRRTRFAAEVGGERRQHGDAAADGRLEAERDTALPGGRLQLRSAPREERLVRGDHGAPGPQRRLDETSGRVEPADEFDYDVDVVTTGQERGVRDPLDAGEVEVARPVRVGLGDDGKLEPGARPRRGRGDRGLTIERRGRPRRRRCRARRVRREGTVGAGVVRCGSDAGCVTGGIVGVAPPVRRDGPLRSTSFSLGTGSRAGSGSARLHSRPMSRTAAVSPDRRHPSP